MARPRKVPLQEDIPDTRSIRIVWPHVGIATSVKVYQGDVVTVPRDVAELLIDRGAAEYA